MNDTPFRHLHKTGNVNSFSSKNRIMMTSGIKCSKSKSEIIVIEISTRTERMSVRAWLVELLWAIDSRLCLIPFFNHFNYWYPFVTTILQSAEHRRTDK